MSFKVSKYPFDKKSKLTKHSTAKTLLDYVHGQEGKKGLTSQEMWMSFQKQAKQTASEEEEEIEVP